MTPPVITFFNNKGGVGKTSLVYHLAWMLADLGYRVVAADLDPQANLTAAFLNEEEVEQLWNSAEPRTMWSAIRPFVDDEGVIQAVTPTPTTDERLALLPGDLSLSRFEDELSSQWRECLDGTRLRPSSSLPHSGRCCGPPPRSTAPRWCSSAWHHAGMSCSAMGCDWISRRRHTNGGSRGSPRTSTAPSLARASPLPNLIRTASPSASITTASCHSRKKRESRCSR